MDKSNIRNIAIIAHVDHGKTTLVDAFLKQSKIFRDNQDEMTQEMILDSGALEREKGITIKAKNIAVRYGDYKINIIDTPGHADFGGEVERTLHMADGALLLVDAQEGPMPQTKFVLKKALELGLPIIVVINKIDKPYAQPKVVLDRVNDLILSLATEEYQLNFPIIYAIGREGLAFEQLPQDLSPDALSGNITPLLDKIIAYIPAPKGDESLPFRMQITTLHFDQHVGRYLIGKINRGKLSVGDPIVLTHPLDVAGESRPKGTVKKILVREGLDFVEVKTASAGEIIAIAGLDVSSIGATLCHPSKLEPIKDIFISQPSVRIKFEANTSPFVGKEGKFVTARLLQNRLEKEIETNISLQITKADGGGYFVAGRGELQLSILIEELRREGFEFQIRKPEIVYQMIDGVKCEPLEELFIEVPAEYQSVIVSEVSERKGTLRHIDVDESTGNVKMEFTILTKFLIGLRNLLLTSTKGNLVMNNFLLEYVPFENHPEPFRRGVLVSSSAGVAMDYSLNTVQERGELFIPPATKVYEGMIIGIHKYENDLEVNPTKERAKSGVRRNQAEITQISLKGIRELSLDFALTFLGSDEILEITPESLRLRKQFLTATERTWSTRKNLNDFAKKQLNS